MQERRLQSEVQKFAVRRPIRDDADEANISQPPGEATDGLVTQRVADNVLFDFLLVVDGRDEVRAVQWSKVGLVWQVEEEHVGRNDAAGFDAA